MTLQKKVFAPYNPLPYGIGITRQPPHRNITLRNGGASRNKGWGEPSSASRSSH